MTRVFIVAAFAICVCLAQAPGHRNPDEIEWQRIRETKSETELLAFIEKYPNSRLAASASRQIDLLAWQKVDKTNHAAVREFLRRHPDLEVELPAGMQADAKKTELATHQAKRSDPPKTLDSPPAAQVRDRANSVTKSDDIDKTLRDLTLAYENKSLEEIRTIWPGISQDALKKVQQAFKDASSIKMTLEPTGPALVEGNMAITVCRRTLDTVYDGQSNLVSSLVSIKMRRAGRQWVIESIQ